MKRRRRPYREVGPFTNIYREPGAWAVRVLRGGRYHVGHFADATFGGRREALTAARRFRDQLFRTIDPDTRVRRRVPKGSRNETRKVGVAFEVYEVDGRRYQRYVAHWKDEDGRSRRRRFSVGKYGDALAFKLAATARNEAVENVRVVLLARQVAEARNRLAVAPPSPRRIKDPKSRKGMRMPPRNPST
jgi:hypothetical protein